MRWTSWCCRARRWTDRRGIRVGMSQLHCRCYWGATKAMRHRLPFAHRPHVLLVLHVHGRDVGMAVESHTPLQVRLPLRVAASGLDGARGDRRIRHHRHPRLRAQRGQPLDDGKVTRIIADATELGVAKVVPGRAGECAPSAPAAARGCRESTHASSGTAAHTPEAQRAIADLSLQARLRRTVPAGRPNRSGRRLPVRRCGGRSDPRVLTPRTTAVARSAELQSCWKKPANAATVRSMPSSPMSRWVASRSVGTSPMLTRTPIDKARPGPWKGRRQPYRRAERSRAAPRPRLEHALPALDRHRLKGSCYLQP